MMRCLAAPRKSKKAGGDPAFGRIPTTRQRGVRNSLNLGGALGCAIFWDRDLTPSPPGGHANFNDIGEISGRLDGQVPRSYLECAALFGVRFDAAFRIFSA